MLNLPKDFLEKMSSLLKEDYDLFIKSYKSPKVQGIRINTLKIDIENFLNINPFHLESIPWVDEGFFFEEKDKPGKHPYHDAGLYYIQEPSAMTVGTVLNPKPGEKILDLCAAPGGKSTHIASRLQGKGILVSNEIIPSRAKILSQNIERMGIKNCIVTNESPENLSKIFKGYFHKILVDAPCSGEGMFRKNPEAIKEWNLKNVSFCADRQLNILNSAAEMLMPEGILVYSTCTFSPEENEGVIDKFLKKNKNFEIQRVNTYKYFDNGKPQWINSTNENLKNTIRLWPHKLKGEGHYIAILKKRDDNIYTTRKAKKIKPLKLKNNLKDFYDFCNNFLTKTPEGNYFLFGEHLYISPLEITDFTKLKVLRPGWHLGTFKKNRFEPSHALALSLKSTEVKNTIPFKSSSEEIYLYLKGESLKINAKKGWSLVLIDGYSIGWSKISNNTLKNHYPKGLRWNV
ncbi:NOL1/NOP2/sun family putative RNA methylase [Caminicella sporogenes DSM 14501]|uniref:NOL1/NOP2/sun family putative RNA methylase n=1 Tax=Caminicella sporogenes DSM 14501 TaxID=1121266 RepID=A0A1M6NKK1_9FIRM|nr:RsmF rRNA methyltransferase first C-terminal domain-containing protein [Caminicella sporogenes]RKD22170.1 RNA methyltransferase [Caminicella sporogenes]SHJ96230.1 NOL1/NOP2/sun family putative RNA methylase [Caminicella sporogenes DSM 14501]